MKDLRVASAERMEVIGLLNRALERGDLTVADFDHKIAAVGAASYTSELLDQLNDLPPEYAWLPPAAVAPDPGAAAAGTGRGALILGLLSIPASFCIFGGILGIIAVWLSTRGERARGFSAALLGRVLGITGVALSIAALAALVITLNR